MEQLKHYSATVLNIDIPERAHRVMKNLGPHHHRPSFQEQDDLLHPELL